MKVKDKKILIIGGTGSLGQTLAKYLYNSNLIFILSRDETKQWLMQNKYLNYDINYYLCDIRDYISLKRAILFLKPQIIINASAIKQVPTCEMFPYESVKTNIIGVENLIKICTDDYEPEVVLGVSTDKACKPVNVYGMCKAIGERLYIAANAANKTRFLCVRYGNVLESRGSIIPLFKYHARTDKIYPLTSPQMSRFFISLDESVKLITTAICLGKKGDTFVPFVKSGRIVDLAEIFVEKFGGKIKKIGIRPGEKIHEELINEEEIRRTYELNEDYLIIKPFISKIHPKYDLTYTPESNARLPKSCLERYSSDLFLLSKDKLYTFLEERNIFEKEFEVYKEDEVRF
jgi:UDP-glucose 4-epimerase